MMAWSSGVSGLRPAQPPAMRASPMIGKRWIAFCTASSTLPQSLGDFRAQLTRATGKAGGDLGRTRERVSGPPHRGDEIVHPKGGHELPSIVGRDHAHVGPELALERDSRFESAELLGVGDEEE